MKKCNTKQEVVWFSKDKRFSIWIKISLTEIHIIECRKDSVINENSNGIGTKIIRNIAILKKTKKKSKHNRIQLLHKGIIIHEYDTVIVISSIDIAILLTKFITATR